MTEYLNTNHMATFLHNRLVTLTASNKNPKTIQAFSALVGLVAIPHKKQEKIKTGRLDVDQPHSDFVAIMVFGEDATVCDPDINKPEFVVMFVESSRMLEMLLLRDPEDRPEFLNFGQDVPFAPASRSLMMFRTTSLQGITNYVIAPSIPMTLTEVVVAGLVNAEFVEKED